MAMKKPTMSQAYKTAEGMESPADKKKEIAMAKKGMHKMPDGKMMKNSSMKKIEKKHKKEKHIDNV